MVSNLINTYSSTFAVVEYHVGASNGDKFTTPWGDSRSSFYGVSTIPFFDYDGLWDAWPYTTYESKFLSRRAVTTDITIQLYGEQVSGQTYEILARVCREAGGTGSKAIRIYMVEVLDAIWSNNGQTLPSYSRNTFRQAAATTDISLTPGQCVDVVKNLTFDSTISWPRKESIRIVAWAQTPSSSGPAEVFKAQWMGWPFPSAGPPPGDMDGSLAVDLNDIDDFVLALVDPAAYEALHPDLDPVALGDINEDGLLDGNDIYPFMFLIIEDVWPPTPDPMTFVAFPAPASTSSVSMTAATATDAASPPVSYYFTFVPGGSGGTDSGWQSSTTYVDSGLVANTAYIYNVKASDSASTPNVTAPSSNASTATYIQTPTGVSFGTSTTSTIDLTAAGTLTNLTTGSSGVYFDSITPDGDGGINAWVQAATDTATALSPNTNYTFQAKARNQNSVETTYSPTAARATLIQTPTGVSFDTVTNNSIVLNADGTLTNLNVGSSGVYFDSITAGGDGGINAWVQVATDTATGLSPDTYYTFQVKARNQNSVETAYTPMAAKATLANVPAAPTLGGATTSTMTLDVNANGNPAVTGFAIQCTAASPNDAAWFGKYVNVAGAPSAAAVWQTDAAWSVVTVSSLQPATTYTFAVKARNQESVETAFGPSATLSTLTP